MEEEPRKGIFDILPVEIVALITEFFDGVTLARWSAVSSKAKALSEFESLWAALINKEKWSGKSTRESSKSFYLRVCKKQWADSQKLKMKKDQVIANLREAPLFKAGFLSRLAQRVGLFTVGKRHYKVVFCGLDAAGKTTFVYKLKMDPKTTIPSIGLNIETAALSNWDFTVWDVGGPDKIRPLWKHYWKDAVALVWIVDSNDRERIEESKTELMKTLYDECFGSPYLLLYANKQDLPNAYSVHEVCERMDLYTLPKEITWHAQSCCATSGDGLIEGLDWLGKTLAQHESIL